MTAFVLFIILSAVPRAEPQFFHHSRTIAAPPDRGPSYLVVDPEIWSSTRDDLGDIRLYDERNREHPYALRTETGKRTSAEVPATVVHAERAHDQTEVIIDTGGPAAEYNLVSLSIQSDDYITGVRVEGWGDHETTPRYLGTYTIYDLRARGLGTNSSIDLPMSSLRFLRLRLTGEVEPGLVKGALVRRVVETPDAWIPIPARVIVSQRPRETFIGWKREESMPLERIEIEVASDSPSFRRRIELRDVNGLVVFSGEITAVREGREGERVVHQSLSLNVPSLRNERVIHAVIVNEDDPPLPLAAVKLLSRERRIYFSPAEGLRLLYGDEAVDPPIYDYDKLLSGTAGASRARLGPPRANPLYRSRPDRRPWSERNPAVLWIAMILAVVGIGAIAIRELRRG